MKELSQKQALQDAPHPAKVVVYREGLFSVMVMSSERQFYRVQNPRYQNFKFHFYCPRPTPDDKDFLTALIHRLNPTNKARLAPCCKLFDQPLAADFKHMPEFTRLSSHASGTLYLPNFEESNVIALAELAFDLSAKFPREDITQLDYSMGFLPYCPGVFIRQAFLSSRHSCTFVPALQVEQALETKGADQCSAYQQLMDGVRLRNALRDNPMYVALCNRLHDKQILQICSLISASRVGSDTPVIAADFTCGVKKLLELMYQYKMENYYEAKRRLQDLRQLLQVCPVLCKGELAKWAQVLQTELTRAAAYCAYRLRFKDRIDPWIREERKKSIRP